MCFQKFQAFTIIVAIILIVLTNNLEARILPASSAKIELFHYNRETTGKDSLICGAEHSNNIYSFTIEATAIQGSINLLLVQHNGDRKLPYSTTTLYDPLNQLDLVTRADNFRKYPCSSVEDKQTSCSSTFKMTEAQAALTGRTAFDRGHLTPADPMKFSDSAIDSTFYCVNIAPQEPFTNQGPWKTIETRTLTKLAAAPGYVMTGICDTDSSDGVTLDGWRVPSCFWKLICYKDNSGVARVVGFIGENALFHKDDESAKNVRRSDTTKPRSQSEILARMNSSTFIQDSWRKAEIYLLDNRVGNDLPSSNECINAITAPTGTLVEWGLV